MLFNELLPTGYPFINQQMHKKVQASIINDLAERYPMIVVAQTVDKLKDAGFYWATRSGVTVSMADVLVPPEKQEILERYEKEADGIEKQYQRGALEPRRAQRRAGQDLAAGDRRGRRGPAGALPGGQPDHHDRRLGRDG